MWEVCILIVSCFLYRVLLYNSDWSGLTILLSRSLKDRGYTCVLPNKVRVLDPPDDTGMVQVRSA